MGIVHILHHLWVTTPLFMPIFPSLVTVLNPTTRRQEQRPLYEMATSNMARRAFVGNLYKKVKDKSMVAVLSGHKSDSKAFDRIKGTEIQIKMFDDRLVFESPGKLPGMVKPDNIRYTHFSRNPKIAAFLKAYHYVKEFGEGLDRICREQEANGAKVPTFRTDEFILKVTVPKETEKVTVKGEKGAEKVIETEQKVTGKVIEKHQKVIEKVIEKAAQQGDRLTENRISILRLMMDNPYISKAELLKYVGISENSISRNIETMRGKYLRRVGPDKGGFWEIIEE